MSGHTFPGRLGTKGNPFGAASSSGRDRSSGIISNVQEEDENDTVASPTSPHFNGSTFGSSSGADGSGEGPPSSFIHTSGEGFPAHYGMGRRTSVSAESLNPTASSNDNWSPPFHQKTPDQEARLKKAISGNFLFNHLDDEQSSQVLGALVEKPIPAKGIKVCNQSSPHFSSRASISLIPSHAPFLKVKYLAVTNRLPRL
jgi:cAMP-dependent protein kinase regulator